jgi:WD40 repeat protein
MRVSDIATSSDGRRVMTSSFDKTAAIADIEVFDDPEPFERVDLGYGNVSVFAVNARGAKLAMACPSQAENGVVIQSIDGRQELQLPRPANWPVTRLEFSSDGEYLALHGAAEQIEIWRVADRPRLVQVNQEIQPSRGNDDPRDAYQLQAEPSGGVRIVDARVGKTVDVMQLRHDSKITSANWYTPGGSFFSEFA